MEANEERKYCDELPLKDVYNLLTRGLNFYEQDCFTIYQEDDNFDQHKIDLMEKCKINVDESITFYKNYWSKS